MHEILNNLLTPFLLSLIIAVGIGFIIGLEREFDNLSGNEHFAGLRAFALMAVLGCIVAFLSQEFETSVIIAAIPSVIIFISVFHYTKIKKDNFGIVTELSLLLVFLLGILSGYHLIKEALAVAVIASALLTLKSKFREAVRRITSDELYAFIRFALLAFLLLPYLPDKGFGPSGILNPQNIGFVVVIVSSLSFAGYFIIKFFGEKKGILFTAFFGGTFSSTAVTWVFSSRSKENENLSFLYAAGILIASAVMFARVAVVAAIFSMEVFMWLVIPCALMMACSLVFAYFIAKRNAPQSHQSGENVSLGNPLDLMNALMFGLQYIAITLIVYYANFFLGTKGLFLTGLISGLADVDAINISASKLSLVQITPSVAAIVVLLAVISNTVFKIGECMIKGSSKLRMQVLYALLPSLLIAVASIVFIYLK